MTQTGDMARPPRLGVEALNVNYHGGGRIFQAVRGATFDVPQGGAFGLVGESGSGKSTVLRAICGLAPTSGGAIKIDGAPLRQPRDKAFHRRVQMVFQDPYASLHPRQTVDQILEEPLAIHRVGDRETRISDALDDVGLDRSFRFRYPHQLSGGQRQRVAIARALILRPAILLLDEPTSALDASVQAEILNLLERLRAEHGLTFLLVSHDLAVVAHHCERLAVMRGGRVLETLTADDLRHGEAESDYTRALVAATDGFLRH